MKDKLRVTMLPLTKRTIFILSYFLCILGPASGIELSEDFNKTVDFILDHTDRDNIANLLRNLSSRPHVGGTPAEWENAHYVSDVWRSQGLDEVHLVPYEVLLSYPVMESPNYARLYDNDGNEVFKSQGRTKPLHSKEEFSDEVFPDFNAFSATGTVEGDLVFINFGTSGDFKKLDDLGVDLKGHIAIAKYGQVFRANIVKAASDRGAIGVLLYPDPEQYAQNGPERVYPDTVSMPGEAAPFGTTLVQDGDPLTPGYPAIESAFRLPEEEAAVPRIPVMPLGYDDASVILSHIGGPLVPPEWRGALNLTYRLGPGFTEAGWKASMEVNTHNQKTKTYNVVGMIRGKEEPDRYVLLGNHRDAWIFGAVDPSSGTAAMLELTRLLTDYRKQTGWQPRRTLVFCSWGSEEYGLIGSSEWTEQFGKQLGDRSVAYLNLDMAIEGNYTLRTKASPLLYGIAKVMSKLVPNPDPEEESSGRTTVYDTWVFRKPDEKHPGLPKFTGLGSGSDYKGFQHNLGIPSLDYRYTHSEKMFAEPLYHTLYETFYLVSNLYDRGFNFHASMTQIWALTGAFLADVQVIPFSLDEYADFISSAQDEIFQEFDTSIKDRNITLDFFRNASRLFSEEVEKFKVVLRNLDTTDFLAVRRANDQIMLVERAFIDPAGLPGRPFFNHVVFAPSSSDSYSSTAFSGLTDALASLKDLPEDERDPVWRVFEEHLAVCTHLLLTASKVLSDDLW